MIAEYHLTSSTRISSTLCPVLLEAAQTFAVCLKDLSAGCLIQGYLGLRVLDHAKALRVAVWLHWLHVCGGDQLASETLEALRHSLGCLLESFLVPTTNDLIFLKVIEWVLYENRCDTQHHLSDLVMCRTRICQ